MKYFLYLRGSPGVGKITVARLLEKELDARLFWFHDLKNAVYDIVKEHRIPRLMDSLTVPIIDFMLDNGDSVIYVRPSPDRVTVEAVRSAVAKHADYIFMPVQLTASYDTLLSRVTERDDPYRINSRADLDKYLGERTIATIDDELVIATDNTTPESIAKLIAAELKQRAKSL